MTETPEERIAARIAIWSPGEYTSLKGKRFSFSEDDLAEMAASYSPSIFRAPHVKGHPQVDDPAYGWNDRLEWDGKYLWAESSQIDPAFAEEVRAGRWGKVSPKFFRPDEPGNPVPGKWYLRHVGWLGAAAPSNKSLPFAAAFADAGADDEAAVFADGVAVPDAVFGEPQRRGFKAIVRWLRKQRERLIANHGIDEADESIPEYLINEVEQAGESDASDAPSAFSESTTESKPEQEEQPMAEDEKKAAAFAERQAELEQRETELNMREQAIAEQTERQRQASCAAFAEQLADDGRILPRDTGFVTALLASVGDDDQVEFAEGDETVTATTGERLRQFLSGYPAQVEFSELSQAEDEGQRSASFAGPPGYNVDQEGLELHRKAEAYQREHGCEYMTAVEAVSHQR